MEYRKIIGFGSSSHVISIPKEWIKENNLKKGDTINIDNNGSSIVISAGESKQIKHQIIDATNLSTEISHKKIVDAYINGADIITLQGDVKKLQEIVQELMALEIIEQTKEKTVLKSFLKIEDVEIENVIKKADYNLNSMFEDLEDLYNRNILESVELSDGITERDSQVNKMCFLLFRKINHELKNKPNSEMLKYWGLTFFLEEVADELKRLARALSTAKDVGRDYFRVISKAKDSYNKAMTGFYAGNKDLIYEVANQRKQLMEECDEIECCQKIIDRTKQFIAKIHNLNRVSY